MISKNILTLTLGISILSVMLAPSMASASLVGDEATVEVFTGVTSLGSQSAIVDTSGDPEFDYFTGPDNEIFIDIESSTIQIDFFDEFTTVFVLGTGENPITIEITDLDWVGQSGNIVGASIVGGPSAFGETVQVTGPDSVEVVVNANNASPVGGTFLSILVQLQTSHAVAGEILPIDSTALFLAGMQSSALWLIPSLIGIAGAGFYLVRAKLN